MNTPGFEPGNQWSEVECSTARQTAPRFRHNCKIFSQTWPLCQDYPLGPLGWVEIPLSMRKFAPRCLFFCTRIGTRAPYWVTKPCYWQHKQQQQRRYSSNRSVIALVFTVVLVSSPSLSAAALLLVAATAIILWLVAAIIWVAAAIVIGVALLKW